MKPLVTIQYCPKCGWLMRAAYMSQEFLTTFSEDIRGVLLSPSDTEGQYSILIDDVSVYDRKEVGKFLEIKKLKRLIRDKVNPDKKLGHSDEPATETNSDASPN